MKLEDKIKILLNYFKVGNHQYVIEKGNELSRQNPNNFYLKNLIGSSYLQIKNFGNAKKNFEASIQLAPKNIAAINNLANTHKILHEYRDAERLYLRAIELSPNYSNALLNLGNLKVNINEIDEAINLYKKVISIDNKNYVAHYSLAMAYQWVGRFEDSTVHCKKTLEINPTFSRADKLMSSNLKYDSSNSHYLKMVEDLNNVKISDDNKVQLHFALIKANEDIGDLNKSINHIEKGNSLKREIINYNLEDDIDLINKIKLSFKDINFNDFEIKNSNKKIIFVLGMPRSGTSLVEQMISGHTKVFGAGELPFLRQIILNSFNKYQNDFKKIINKNETLQFIANDYFDKLSIFKNNDKFILDKSPLNFLWIGFIRILFPGAKVIHIKRNSKDNCYSLYKNLFDNNLNFTYQKIELATFYNAYSDLIKFWNEKTNDFIHTVEYEKLVNEPEKNLKTIFKFCELEYEKKCLNFDENTSPIKTASSAQARKKIYKSSIKSYKNHEETLSDLFNNILE
jgi:tetratricopeptide (TPR) repeat protein